jgi:hypothetical protein
MLDASLGHGDLEVRVSFPAVGFIEPTRPEHVQLRPWSYDFQTERACNLHAEIISNFLFSEKREFLRADNAISWSNRGIPEHLAASPARKR